MYCQVLDGRIALIRSKDWLKLAGREGAGKDGKAEILWRVGKSEKVGFKARKKLIAGERKCSKRVGRSKISDWDGAVCVRSKGS